MNYFSVILIVVMSLLTGCGNVEVSPDENLNPPVTDAKAEYRKISAEEAHTMMEQLSDYILLDVRTDDEYKEKRINGSVLIPDYEIKDRAEKELTDKNKVILIYCRSGRRSANAALKIIDMGYTNVYDFGGIIDWIYDTVSD